MWKKITIQADERGLLLKDGVYVRLLRPGVHRLSPFADYAVTLLNVSRPFAVPGKELNLFLQDAALAEELTVIEVEDNEYALHYEDGKFVRLLTAGKHAFWNALKRHTFIRIELREPALGPEISTAIVPRLVGFCQTFEVASHERGLLFYNHVLQRELGPGKYSFWKGPVAVSVQTVDLRRRQLDLTGQEMMTEDKVTLRLNFVCHFAVTDPKRATEIKSFEEQLHVLMQLVLREYVGTLKLDDLLRMKQEIGAFVLGRLREKSDDYGVSFHSAGVKDIILPGDMKDILNTVLLAEKKAQANLITRREETASTRSLLNTAKLMEDNATLYRLKELEFLEKICENIGTLSVGGDGLLTQLNGLLGTKAEKR